MSEYIYGFLIFLLIPGIFFSGGALVQHREITKNKSKKLKIVIIPVILALSLLMMAYPSYYGFIDSLLPSFFDSIDLFFAVWMGGFYLLALGIIFVLGCFTRWAVHKAGSSFRK